jgi:SPX domain protein involved in polyphosphate accumulation
VRKISYLYNFVVSHHSSTASASAAVAPLSILRSIQKGKEMVKRGNKNFKKRNNIFELM